MPETGVVVKREKESEFEWKIRNFSLSESSYWSPEFTFESESWCLGVFPYNRDGYTGVCLSRLSPGSHIEIELSVAFKAVDGRKIFERREKILRSFYAHDQWIHRSEFINRQREILSSRCLTIILILKRVCSIESEGELGISQPSVFPPKNKILQDFKQMFLSQENCDVVLKVQDKEFSAHKNILVARSPVFASTFRSNMTETVTGTVDIKDVDPSCFSEFLCFLYCGEIDKISAENVSSLFAAADKYQITDLRTLCIEFMKKNLSVDVFCETLVLSLLYSESDLINACEDFFVKNAGKITETDQWESFAHENPKQSNKMLMKYVKSTTRSNR